MDAQTPHAGSIGRREANAGIVGRIVGEELISEAQAIAQVGLFERVDAQLLLQVEGGQGLKQLRLGLRAAQRGKRQRLSAMAHLSR